MSQPALFRYIDSWGWICPACGAYARSVSKEASSRDLREHVAVCTKKRKP